MKLPNPRKLLRDSLKYLPREIRFQIYRRMLSLNIEPKKNLVLKIAQTKEELEAAFSILHDAYVDSGYMKPHPSGMRLTIYHALPTTTTLVALWDGVVVGTVSIVRSNALGLPLEKIFDVSDFKRAGKRLAEISALAIRKDFRGKSGEVLLPLQKFLYEYCVRYTVVDYMLIAINPKHVDYYESILLFERIDQDIVENYSYVSGAPAVGEYLDLRTSIHRFCSVYFNKPARKDVFSYFYYLEMDNIQWPDRTYFKVTDPVMTPELLDYFFNQRTRLFSELSQKEKDLLGLLYDHAKYAAVLPRSASHRQYRDMCQEKRYDVNCKGRILIDDNKGVVPIAVKNVSGRGFGAYLEEDIHFGELFTVNIAIGDFDIVDLEAYPLWRDEDGMHGFRVVTASPNWQAFIEHLKRDLQKESEKVAA